jgi:putative PIN family toxin of toxin-antitoxin system
MRVVLDTNILISAALKADSAPRLALRWVAQRGVLLKSADTEEEFYRTLRKPKLARLLAGDFLIRLDRLMENAEGVKVVERIRACRDPDDDKFLELAVNGGANMIVSGDTDLRLLRTFRGIPIVGPAAFVRGSNEEPERR